jgi:uncharacterized membrane protein
VTRIMRAFFTILGGALTGAALGVIFGFVFMHTTAATTSAFKFNSFNEWWFHYSGAWGELDYHLISLLLIIPLALIGLIAGGTHNFPKKDFIV